VVALALRHLLHWRRLNFVRRLTQFDLMLGTGEIGGARCRRIFFERICMIPLVKVGRTSKGNADIPMACRIIHDGQIRRGE